MMRISIKLFYLILILGTLVLGLGFENPGLSQSTVSEFVYAMPYDFTEFSVFRHFSYATAQWMGAIFAGAYERDSSANGSYVPLLAEGMPTVQEVSGEADGTVMIVTVKLKPGLKFSNGDPLTAEDFVFTALLHMTPMIGSALYGELTSVFLRSNDSVKAVDDLTVEFRFKEKSSFFTRFIAFSIVPKEIYKPAVDSGKYDFEVNPEKYLIGAGPFMLGSIDTTNNVVTVVKNPNWWLAGLGEPAVDRVVFKKIATKEAALQELEQGNVDLVGAQYNIGQYNKSYGVSKPIPEFVVNEMALNHIHPVWGHTAQLDAFLGVTFTYSATGQSYTVRSFWDEISKGAMTEADRVEAARLVREAMSHIVPREDIVSNILEGLGIPAAIPMPVASIGRNQSLVPREYSVELAGLKIKEAFALAGWSNITTDPALPGIYFANLSQYFPDWSIALLSPNTFPARSQWATLMEAEFPRIGIDVRLHANTGWDVIAPRTFNFDISAADYGRDDGLHTPVPLWDQQGFDLLFVGYAWGLDWDPQGLWETWAWLPFGFNFYNYWDPDYDALTDSYVQELDPVQRNDRSLAVQEYLYRMQPSIPIVNSAKIWVYSQEWDFTEQELLLLGATAFQWRKLGGTVGFTDTSTSPTDHSTDTSTSPTTDLTNSSTSTGDGLTSVTAPGLPLFFDSFFALAGIITFAAVVALKRRNKYN